METYNQFCRKLMQTTNGKETHHIVVKAMEKYGEFKGGGENYGCNRLFSNR